MNGQTIRCVGNGPFSKLRPTCDCISSAEFEYKPHCLHRSLVDGETEGSIISTSYYNATYAAIVQKNARLDTYHMALEGGPHGIIYSAMGGEMSPATSPNGMNIKASQDE